MSAVPTIYRSTDAGAPVLSGTPGSFAALLDAVLVDGYGSGGDAKAPLGWVREFSDGHKRVFRNDESAGATGYLIRFDDSFTSTCEVTAFESMSDVDTGINQFSSSPGVWQKSRTENTISRPWIIVGNDRSVYYFNNSGGSIYDRDTGWFFGDLIGFGGQAVWMFAYSEGWFRGNQYYSGMGSSNVGSFPGMRAARNYDGATVGDRIRNRSSLLSGMQVFGGAGSSGGLPYPYPSTQGTVLSQVLVVDDSSIYRGRMPGLLIAEHIDSHDDGVVYSGFSDLPAGTELLCKMVKRDNSSNVTPKVMVDLSNPWY